jgi:hypothetical protein
MATNIKKETWKEFKLDYKAKFRYAISNHGRIKSFEKDLKKGTILKGGLTDGYQIFRYKYTKRNKVVNKHLFLHKLVAKAFIPNRSESKMYVLHLDHVRLNNKVSNLKWATREEMIAHSQTSPKVIKWKKGIIKFNKESNGAKLTVAQARVLKKQLLNPNRRTTFTVLAKQYGVSLMALHRIKTGENWGHLKVS